MDHIEGLDFRQFVSLLKTPREDGKYATSDARLAVVVAKEALRLNNEKFVSKLDAVNAERGANALYDRVLKHLGSSGYAINGNFIQSVLYKPESADVVHFQRLFYYFLTSSELQDPGYAEAVSQALFGQSFWNCFDREMVELGIPRPSYLPPIKQLKLGRLRLSLGNDLGVIPMEPVVAHPGARSKPDLSDVSRTLSWRTSPTKLHGRKSELDKIVAWADSPKKPDLQVRFISGPGGTGKTRLAMEAGEKLAKKGWHASILPRRIDEDTVFRADPERTLIIIDYPEDYRDFFDEFLKDCRAHAHNGAKIRILLVSREPMEKWAQRVGRLNGTSISETPLEPLAKKDNQAASISIVRDFAKACGQSAWLTEENIDAARKWLSLKKSNRKPLFVLAATLHGMVQPEHAFGLSNLEVLNFLVNRERGRVRDYAEQAQLEPKLLERLVAAACFTSDGLAASQISNLSDDFIDLRSDASTSLQKVRETPFWARTGIAGNGRLTQLEPDLFGEAFAVSVFEMHLPSMPLFLTLLRVGPPEGDRFVATLNRYLYDCELFGSDVFNTLRIMLGSFVEDRPDLLRSFSVVSPNAFHSGLRSFLLGVANAALPEAQNRVERFAAMSAAADAKLKSGLPLEAAKEAHQAVTQLMEHHDEFGGKAQTLHRQFNAILTVVDALNQLGEYDKAEDRLRYARDTIRRYEDGPDHSPQILVEMNIRHLLSAAQVFNEAGKYSTATDFIFSAEQIISKLNLSDPDNIRLVVEFFVEASDIYQSTGVMEAPLEQSQQAVELSRQLIPHSPSAGYRNLALSLRSSSYRLGEQGDEVGAINSAVDAVKAAKRAAEYDRDAHLSVLASCLSCLATVLGKFGHHRQAWEESNKCIGIRELVHTHIDQTQWDKYVENLLDHAVYEILFSDSIAAFDCIERAKELIEADSDVYFLKRYFYRSIYHYYKAELLHRDERYRDSHKHSKRAVKILSKIVYSRNARVAQFFKTALLRYQEISHERGFKLGWLLMRKSNKSLRFCESEIEGFR